MLLLTLLSALVALALIGLYWLEGRLGLGPFFAFVIACQAFQNFLISTVSMDLLGRFPVSPGSAVLVSASLFAILLIFLEEGLGATRRLIYGVLFANATLILLTMSTQWGLALGRVRSLYPVSELFELFNLRGFAVGTLLIVLDAVLLIAIHEILRARARWLPAAGRVALSLLVVLVFDAVIFVTVGLGEGTGSLLAGDLLGKLVAGSVYSIALTLFLSADVDTEKIDTAEIKDPLAMFTQRERYKLLQLDKKRTETNLRRLFESNVVGMNIATADGQIVSANGHFLEMLGYSREDLPLCWDELTPADWQARDSAKTEELLETGKCTSWEKEYRHRDGHRVPVLIAVTQMEGAEGQCLSVVVDLTLIRRAERALRASEQRYRSLFEEIPLMYFSLDKSGIMRSVNTQGAADLGYQSDELVGRSVLELSHPADHSAVSKSLQTALASPAEVEECEVRKVRKDGSVLTVHERVRVVQTPEGISEVLVVGEDITARKEAEEKVAHQQEMLRELAGSLASVEERERRRIGQELHDGLGQNLAIAQLNLGKLLEEEMDREIETVISKTRDLMVRTMESARSLSFELTSPVLYELGLGAALKDLAERTARETSLAVEFQGSGTNQELADDQAAVLFRATQELILNVVKHARAEKLQIGLESLPDRVSITVEDDGAGFEEVVAADRFSTEGGLGLSSVRQQFDRLGGALEIHSRPGEGTRVIISAPTDSMKRRRGDRE